jgi:biofilm PGA synthesis N-glycosyltransferase PgaC
MRTSDVRSPIAESTAPPAVRKVAGRGHLAMVICFLNEAEHLPTLLDSLSRQTEPPDQVLLVDDGSTDGSEMIAARCAASWPHVRALRRPPRPAETDRLAQAPELQAFAWGVTRLTPGWDIVAKLDGDLKLSADLCESVRDEFAADERLGIAGSYLSLITPDGELQREPHRPDHVRGATKFYRRACFEAIEPLPAFLGWDTVDELRARQRGWTTRSFSPAAGDTIHLRPTGAHDGRLRAYRRWGQCAWAYGSHPLWVVLGALRRTRRTPYILAGASFWWGWAAAGLRGYPRAESQLRAYTRREQIGTIRAALRRPRA